MKRKHVFLDLKLVTHVQETSVSFQAIFYNHMKLASKINVSIIIIL